MKLEDILLGLAGAVAFAIFIWAFITPEQLTLQQQRRSPSEAHHVG